LRFAQTDLIYATAPVPEGALYNAACFHAQQAARKSIKAVLTHLAVEFERVHSISYLIRILPTNIPPLPQHDEAIRLTQYAVVMRYPGAFGELTEDDQRRAAHVALAVVNWAQRIISSE